MRNTCGKVVRGLWNGGGITADLSNAAHKGLHRAVRKVTGFTPNRTQFVYNFMHQETIHFTPVMIQVLPTFHSTNKELMQT
jgi:hypothetical protein